jgi:hypothetical protein
MEAYADMANDKKKKRQDRNDGASPRELAEKLREAYRRGDLDLLDSLDLQMEQSPAFREKFLYKRNEIQAASIDSILQKSSLFVGVGAAHLAGQRGVIAMLRSKGYQLRPVMMIDRDAAAKEATDRLKVPVQFNPYNSPDGSFTVAVPGPLYPAGDMQRLHRLQYADMANGSYYMVTRVRTPIFLTGFNAAAVLKKTDSLLYEYIPGKILSRKNINRNGYPGLDIINKTRRGDLQRYQLFIMPGETIIFKMSGRENYTDGKEAQNFFNSIQLQPTTTGQQIFSPAAGGFSIQLPHRPIVFTSPDASYNDRVEYEAYDSVTGHSYLIITKSLYNIRFAVADSFDVKLPEQSLNGSPAFSHQLSRRYSSKDGFPVLHTCEKMKDSSFVFTQHIIRGPHHYSVAVKTSDSSRMTNDPYFNSFTLTSFRPSPASLFIDTFLHFSVRTTAIPMLNNEYRQTVEKVTRQMQKSRDYGYTESYWPKSKFALFSNKATNEFVGISVTPFAKYYFVHDTTNFWKKEIEERYEKKDLVLVNKKMFGEKGRWHTCTFELRDTGSSKLIKRKLVLSGNQIYSLYTITDTVAKSSAFIDTFFNSFTPLPAPDSRDIFTNTLPAFFKDLHSKDSTTKADARKYLSDVYYGERNIEAIIKQINTLDTADLEYAPLKTKLIAELGYIKDSNLHTVVPHLEKIYRSTADTAVFQNAVINALARHKTKAAYTLLGKLLTKDPPVFDNNNGYTNLFSQLDDSLTLAAMLYPQLLQLMNLDDYKEPVINMLARLCDSSLVKPATFATQYQKFYLDARILMKKQQYRDEQKKIADRNKNDEDNGRFTQTVRVSNSSTDNLKEYATLLAPFYGKDSLVKDLFKKLLASGNQSLQIHSATALIKNNLPVSDSLLQSLAANDEWRVSLYNKLYQVQKTTFFPNRYKTQLYMARSLLTQQINGKEELDSLQFNYSVATLYQGQPGRIYAFTYKLKKEDDWKMGFCGLLPSDTNQVNLVTKWISIPDKIIKPGKPVQQQLQEQLSLLLFKTHKSAARFNIDNGSRSNYVTTVEDEE